MYAFYAIMRLVADLRCSDWYEDVKDVAYQSAIASEWAAEVVFAPAFPF